MFTCCVTHGDHEGMETANRNCDWYRSIAAKLLLRLNGIPQCWVDILVNRMKIILEVNVKTYGACIGKLYVMIELVLLIIMISSMIYVMCH